MGNERKLRLIQVAKEFNVGINTITDFCTRRASRATVRPTRRSTADTYAILEKEFGANRAASSARDSIRERISLKQTTVTIDGRQAGPRGGEGGRHQEQRHQRARRNPAAQVPG